MVRFGVPNLATDWKARVGVAVLALAIGLTITLVTGKTGLGGIVLGGLGILINTVRYWQERAARPQASVGQTSDSN
jgi:hypothetical protein